MTDPVAPDAPEYLLLKRGLYYRPDNHGYTGIKAHAGRYLEGEANPDSGVTAVHEADAPEFSSGCFHDLAIKHLTKQRADLIEQVRALVGALGGLASNEAFYRTAHDLWGGGDIRTGRAWDAMRRSGDEARATLTEATAAMKGLGYADAAEGVGQ